MISVSESTIKKFLKIFAVLASAAMIASGFFSAPELPEELALFVGRFHPLVVHMPIGFVTAVLLIQLVAIYRRADLRLAVRTLLWFTMISGILSAVFGTLLAIPGGYDEVLLERHRWLGIGTSIACIWMLVAHQSNRKQRDMLYSLCLLICMGLVGATGHLGGALTHGEGYLTAYLPEVLGGPALPEPIDPGTKEDAAIYGRVIQPLLQSKCVSCHNPGKNNGDLQMHDLASLLKGGKHGPAINTKSASESLLITRAELPLEHKEHMPPKGKVQLTDPELELLRWWIGQDAPERVALDGDLPQDESIALMESALSFAIAEPKLPLLSWEETVEASKPLHNNPNVRIRRVSLDTPVVDVFFEPSSDNIDALVAQLLPIKANILLLDLSNTEFTDAAVEQLAGFTNLEELRLNNTPITDAHVAQFERLRQLRKLNLYGTQISDAALVALRKLPELRQVNTYETEATYEAAEQFIAEMENEVVQRKLENKIKQLKSQLLSLAVEVVGIEPEPPATTLAASLEKFNSDTSSYGTLVTKRARVAVSSTSVHDPPNGLRSLIQEKGEELPFSFHTAEEKNPWVSFNYQAPIRLNAISIRNRTDLTERAAGLVLEGKLSTANEIVVVTNTMDTKLTEYALGQRLQGRYITMRFTGPGTCNPGGSELVLALGPESAYQKDVLALKPIAYYSFDTADLAKADTASNLGSLANSATLAGGARFSGESGGYIGGALTIDDNSNHVLLVDDGAIALGQDWTISTWFQGLHDSSNFRTLTRSKDDGADHQVIINNGTDNLGLYNNGDPEARGFQDSGYDLLLGDAAWHHLVAVGTGGDAGKTEFYIDGKHVATVEQGSSGNVYAIGNYQHGTQPFAQALDEFAVFDRALTTAQIAILAGNKPAPAKVADTVLLPAPVKATASSEFSENYAVTHLFDGAPTIQDLGTSQMLGTQYAGKGPGPHVVSYDMGASVTFDRIFYAQRPTNLCDATNTIEFWVSDSDPGPTSTEMPMLGGSGWQEIHAFEGTPSAWNVDLTELPSDKRTATDFRLVIKKEKAILHLQKVLLWGESRPASVSVSILDAGKGKYGSRISTEAKVSVSSTTVHDPPAGLKALIQDKDNGLDFAFHTGNEMKPWVQFSYPIETTVHAIHIVNRKDLIERAEDLALQSSKDGKTWDEIWASDAVAPEWTLDLTKVPVAKREAKYFRLILDRESPATLHLSQVHMWGIGQAPAKPEAAVAPARTGQGDWIYEVVSNWGAVPGHDHIGATNGSIVIDKSGKVYVSTDGPHGLIVYEQDGTFIKSLGPHTKRFHGMNIAEENAKEYIFAAAMGIVYKIDLDGHVVLKIEGAKQAPENIWAKATAVAIAPNGDLFIADGYGSSVIYKYQSDGTFIRKFGLRGKKDGQFTISHGLIIDARNPKAPLLLVCDRENGRLQHFDLDGNFVEVIIDGLRRPCAASIHNDFMLVAELAGRAVILDKNNEIVSILGDNPQVKQRANFRVPPKDWKEGVFTAPHGCCFDAKGNVYIQDWNKFGRITKLVRVAK